MPRQDFVVDVVVCLGLGVRSPCKNSLRLQVPRAEVVRWLRDHGPTAHLSFHVPTFPARILHSASLLSFFLRYSPDLQLTLTHYALITDRTEHLTSRRSSSRSTIAGPPCTPPRVCTRVLIASHDPSRPATPAPSRPLASSTRMLHLHMLYANKYGLRCHRLCCVCFNGCLVVSLHLSQEYVKIHQNTSFSGAFSVSAGHVPHGE